MNSAADMQGDFCQDHEKQVKALLNNELDLGVGINNKYKVFGMSSWAESGPMYRAKKDGKWP